MHLILFKGGTTPPFLLFCFLFSYSIIPFFGEKFLFFKLFARFTPTFCLFW